MSSSEQNDGTDPDEDIKSMVRRILLSQDKLDKDVRTSIAQHAVHTAKIDTLNSEVRTLTVQMNRAQREKNVIFFNLAGNATSGQDLVAAVREVLGKVDIILPDCAVDDMFCLRGSGAKRPVLAKFTTSILVRQIFSKAANLRKLGIRIDNDMTPAERDAKKTLLAARWKLKSAGINAYMRKNALFLDGRKIEPADVDSILSRAKTPAPPAPSNNTSTSLPGACSASLTHDWSSSRTEHNGRESRRPAPPPPTTGVATALSGASAAPLLPAGGDQDTECCHSPFRKRSGSPLSKTIRNKQTKKTLDSRQTKSPSSPLRQSKLNFLAMPTQAHPTPLTQPNDQLTESPMSTSDTEG